MDSERIKEILEDIGCPENAAAEIIRLNESGRLNEALHKMKLDRCRLMDALHQSGRRVDSLDYLIRQTEKEMQNLRSNGD